jgi:bifunctional DNase/RNase
MSDMVEVVIDSVRVSLMSPQRVVVLRQTEIERYLPIWVGPYEAEAITVALQETEVARPLTHDLLRNLFTVFNAKILRVEIVTLKDEVFFGNIVVETDGKILDIDSRPSDAIALAVRVHAPILVSQDVMDAAGIIPERDIQADAGPEMREEKTRPLPRSETEIEDSEKVENEKGLDVFEDFLKKLKDDPGDEEKPKS